MDTITLILHQDRIRQLQAEAAEERLAAELLPRRSAAPARRPDPSTRWRHTQRSTP